MNKKTGGFFLLLRSVFLFQKIRQGQAAQIAVYHAVELFPYRKGPACIRPRAFEGSGKAGDGGDGPLRRLQYFADGVSLRGPGQRCEIRIEIVLNEVMPRKASPGGVFVPLGGRGGDVGWIAGPGSHVEDLRGGVFQGLCADAVLSHPEPFRLDPISPVDGQDPVIAWILDRIALICPEELDRERVQVFEGIVIKRQGSSNRETFTVRKNSNGVGVEKTWPLHSPNVEKIEVIRRGKVRRAKLFYLRERVGKRAKVKELVK